MAEEARARTGRWWKVLLAVGAVLLVLVVVLTQVALWGSRGNLAAFVDGQRDPGPELSPTVSTDPPDVEPYQVALTVGTETLREVDERYLSFAIDTSAVVGGKWWDPRAESTEGGSGTVNAPIFDFARDRLDVLTSALAPAILRIGGSEADKVFYDPRVTSGSPDPPEGYESVMTGEQWDDVTDFADRNGLDLVFTLNAGPAARDEVGVWQPENAEALLAYSREQGDDVAGWELGNELNLYWFVHGLGDQVPAEQYADDLRAARGLVGEYYPSSDVSGQGAAFWPVFGEPLGVFFGFQDDYARLSGTDTDVFSWHYYPQQSKRGQIASRRAYPGRLLDPSNLDEAAHWADRNAALRDEHAPQAPLWLAETGNAQFGGEPGLSDRYLASLWWMDQLGLLARHEHDVVIRQTLAGSNYQLITDDTLEPLPDYWASLLWKRLMGTEVLEAAASGEDADTLRVYAHRTPDADGVTLLAVNLDPQRQAEVALPELSGDRAVYAMTGPDLFGTDVLLNGERLGLEGDALPELVGEPLLAEADTVTINPLSYTFVTVMP